MFPVDHADYITRLDILIELGLVLEYTDKVREALEIYLNRCIDENSIPELHIYYQYIDLLLDDNDPSIAKLH